MVVITIACNWLPKFGEIIPREILLPGLLPGFCLSAGKIILGYFRVPDNMKQQHVVA